MFDCKNHIFVIQKKKLMKLKNECCGYNPNNYRSCHLKKHYSSVMAVVSIFATSSGDRCHLRREQNKFDF
jgi:hypothetical protein